MSRQIIISYQLNSITTAIDIGEWYMLGTQQVSYQFWSLPVLKEIGLERLTVLGYADPVDFMGWDDLEDLDKEISLLEDNFELINFDEETKKQWFGNLRSSLNRLLVLSPQDSIPFFEIG